MQFELNEGSGRTNGCQLVASFLFVIKLLYLCLKNSKTSFGGIFILRKVTIKTISRPNKGLDKNGIEASWYLFIICFIVLVLTVFKFVKRVCWQFSLNDGGN